MKSAMSFLIAFLLSLASFSCRGQKVDNSTVRSLDLDRYLGSWFEIARFDHNFERGLTHARAFYSLKDDCALVGSGSSKYLWVLSRTP